MIDAPNTRPADPRAVDANLEIPIEPVPRVSYGHAARSAIIWNTGFNLFRDLLQFGQMLVLARLLSPDDYGKFNFVTSIVSFVAVFSANSFLSYLLYARSEKDTHYQDHFTATVVLQLNGFVLLNLIAFSLHISETYGQVALLLHVMSWTLVLDIGCEISRKMIERDLDWKSLRLLHGVGLILSTVTAIILALFGAGAYALVFPGMLVTLPFAYELFIRRRWRPSWEWSWKRYRNAFRFGVSRIGAGVAVMGRQLLETVVLTSVLGFGPLGIVNRAVGLSQMACGRLAAQLMTSVHPVLTRLETTTGQAGTAGDLLLRFVGWVTIPIACCMSVLALPVIRAVYGEQWLAAAPLLTWTLGWAVSLAFVQVTYWLSLARELARICLLADVLVLLGTAVCLATLLRHGVVVYFAGLICVYQIAFWGLAANLVRQAALSRRGLLLAFGPPLLISIVLLVFWRMIEAFGEMRLDKFLPAALWAACFLLSYAVGVRLAFATPLSQMVRHLPASATFSRLIRLPM